MRKLLTALGIGGYLLCSPLDSVAQHGGTTDDALACKSGQTLGCISNTPTPAKKKTGSSKAVRQLQAEVNALNRRGNSLVADRQREKSALEQRLVGYDAGYKNLQKQVDALSGNPGLQVLAEVFYGGVAPSKEKMDTACRNNTRAYDAFLGAEDKYNVQRGELVGKIRAAVSSTDSTPQQQAAEAGKFEKQLADLDAQRQKERARWNKSRDQLAELCTEAEAQYKAGVAAFEARKKELATWVKQNLTHRPEQFTLRLNQGGFFNDEASQASTSAKVGYNTKRDWTFSLEGGLLYGEATSTSVPFGTSGERTPVGDDLQREYNEEGTRTTTQRYQNFLQLGVEKSWKLDKARKVSLGLGVTAGVLSGEETTTEKATRILALYDNAGNAVGDSQTVTESATDIETLRDFVVGAHAELRRKFWGNLDVALGGALLYDTELNRKLPRVYLGLGANW